ncbi:MAG: patatin-like phospholipase family protein [Candidatus Buchananbacteria bacterium]
MENIQRPKIGLALGSGGAKGLSHIGIIKAFEKNNIPIDFIAGSSIGALIGSFYAAHKDSALMEKTALGTNWKTSFYLIDPAWPQGFIKGKKIESLLKDWLKKVDFSNLQIPLTVVATDLITGQEVDLSTGDIITAVRSSLSVPAIFEPVKYQNYLLADGGLCNPLPSEVVRKMGADIVIGVNLDSGNFGLEQTEIFSGSAKINWSKISIRSLNILRHYLAKNSFDLADLIIEPEVAEIGLMGWKEFFDTKQTQKLIDSGFSAAQAAMPKIKKLIEQK